MTADVAPRSVTPDAIPRAWAISAVVTLASSAALAYAFLPVHAGEPVVLGTIGATYLALSVATVVYLRRRGELVERLAPRRLDITIGALLAGLTYMLATVVHVFVTSSGARQGWIMRVYLHVGDSRVAASFAVGIGVLLVAAAEEIVWRGWVQAALGRAYRPTKAWLITSGLYALAHVSTVYLLRDTTAGLNPLILVAATFCGLLWGYLAMRLDRIGPSIFAHALFSWSVVEFPLYRM
jgi:CAAX protease family protein